MNSFLILVKKDFLCFFNGFGKKNKEATGKNTSHNLIFAIFFLAFFFGLSTMYFFMFGEGAAKINKMDTLFEIGFLISSILVLISSIGRGREILFANKDYDLLMSFPISKNIIIASKLTSLYFFSLLFSSLIVFPGLICYSYYVGFNFLIVLCTIVELLFCNLFAIAIGALFAWLLNLITSKFKNGKMITTIIMIVIFCAFMGVTFLFSFIGSGETEAEVTESLLKTFDSIDKICSYMFFNRWTFKGAKGDPLYFFLSFLLNIGTFSLLVVLFGLNYVKSYALANKTFSSKKFDVNSAKSISSPMVAIAKKEIKTVFSQVNIVLNTLTGPLMGTIALFVLIFVKSRFFIEVTVGEQKETLSIINEVVFVLVLFFNGMINGTCSSISLEGKNFWIIKASPIDEREIIKGKILAFFCMNLPFIVLEFIISFFVCDNIFLPFALLLLGLLINISTCILGILINLKYPKFDWSNVITVVKQSKAVFVSMLVDMVSITVLALLFFLLSFMVNIYVGCFSITVILIVASLILYKIIVVKGPKYINRISC